MRLLLPLILAASAAYAQSPSIFPAEFNTPQTHHDGEIWLTFLARANDTFPYALTVANSRANTRLDWHSHPEGQRLVVTEGKGYYQERGQRARIMRPGMVFECPPGVEHFHAASPNQDVVYLAIYPEAPTQWGAPVTDEEYAAVPAQDSAYNVEEVLSLSRDKWRWMAAGDSEALREVCARGAVFVDPEGTHRLADRLEAIQTGGQRYAGLEIEGTRADVDDVTAIVLNQITLPAEVSTAVPPRRYSVTEVYVRGGGHWRLGLETWTSAGD